MPLQIQTFHFQIRTFHTEETLTEYTKLKNILLKNLYLKRWGAPSAEKNKPHLLGLCPIAPVSLKSTALLSPA